MALARTESGVKRVRVRKFFDGLALQCVFCKQKGHGLHFCPSIPTAPEVKRQFVEALLGIPVCKLNYLEGLSLPKAWCAIVAKGRAFNEGNPWQTDDRPMYQLRKNLGFWKAIGANNTVLSWIAYGVQMRFVTAPPPKRFMNYHVSEEQGEFIDKEIREHVRDGVFSVLSEDQVRVSNPMIVTSNSNGKYRRCDDMRYVNAYLASPMFKMQSLERDVPHAVLPGHVLFTRDLAKAYYKIPVEEKSRSYQCFYWKGNYYTSNAMLFGFCQAPFIFTKVCRPIVRLCGALLIHVVNFVDDFLFSETAREIMDLQRFVDNVFHMLGWILSEKVETGVRVKFLGFIVDAEKRMFMVPDGVKLKVSKMIEAACAASHEGRCLGTKDIERLTGKLVSLRLAVPSMGVWVRSLYQDMERASGDAVVVSQESERNLSVVMLLLSRDPKAPFMSPEVEIDMYVDSSEVGWGATIPGLEKWGLFRAEFIGRSSTFRELRGLWEALNSKDVESRIEGRTVRINMDSTGAIANLTHSGGVRELAEQVVEITKWFLAHSVTPVFRWTRRDTPQLANVDRLSKTCTFSLVPRRAREWSRRLQREVLCPDHNVMGEALTVVLAKRNACAVLMPKWQAKTWWQTAVANAWRIEQVPQDHIVWSAGVVNRPAWEFVMGVFF